MHTLAILVIAAAGMSILSGWHGLLAADGPPQRDAVQITELLDAYDKGEHQRVLQVFATTADVVALRKAFEREGDGWVARAGAAAAPRRRLVAATAALEFAAVRMEDEWKSLRSLVEWGCALIRRQPAGDIELVWHLAAVALAQGARDDAFLFGSTGSLHGYRHLGHARSRFPEEPRFQLAEVWLNASEPVIGERWISDGELGTQGTVGLFRVGARRRQEGHIRQLEKLWDVDGIGSEAAVLAGFLGVALNRPDQAQHAFQRATGENTEPFVRYLAHFLTGRTHERLEQFAQADAAYERALAVIPYAQSASLARAGMLFRAGSVDAALALVNDSLARRPRPIDPWRLFGYGDFRRLPQLLERLREVLQP